VEFVFSNLIDNAVEKMRKIPNRDEQPHTLNVEVEMNNNGKTVTVFVRDTGGGMKPDILNRLNTQRAPLATSDGAGLGIYLSKEILTLMRGEMEHSNNDPFGVTAKVTLNLVEGRKEYERNEDGGYTKSAHRG
jgi:C4-dicarboxylate-specific signal transduction histidine kinase